MIIPKSLRNLMLEKYSMGKNSNGSHGFQKQEIFVSGRCSKYMKIIPMERTRASDIINKLTLIFAMLGLPIEIVTDNGPHDSHLFKEYLRKGDIKHTTVP